MPTYRTALRSTTTTTTKKNFWKRKKYRESSISKPLTSLCKVQDSVNKRIAFISVLTLASLIREAIMIRLTLVTCPSTHSRFTRTLPCDDVTAVVK